METDRHSDLENQAVLEKISYIQENENYSCPSIERKPMGKKNGLIAVGAAILAFLAKAKGILFLVLSKFKILFIMFKLGKFGTTAISMALMVWVYA